jgi:hypothetical protein
MHDSGGGLSASSSFWGGASSADPLQEPSPFLFEVHRRLPARFSLCIYVLFQSYREGRAHMTTPLCKIRNANYYVQFASDREVCVCICVLRRRPRWRAWDQRRRRRSDPRTGRYIYISPPWNNCTLC